MSELPEKDVPAFRHFVRMKPAMLRELLVNAQHQAQEQPQAHLQHMFKTIVTISRSIRTLYDCARLFTTIPD